MTTFYYIAFVEVAAEAKGFNVIDEKWLTDIPPFWPGDNMTTGRMPLAIFTRLLNVQWPAGAEQPKSKTLPDPGMYRLNAHGKVEFGCDDDGGTMHLTLDSSSFEKVSPSSVDSWFTNPQLIRPTFMKVTIAGELQPEQPDVPSLV